MEGAEEVGAGIMRKEELEWRKRGKSDLTTQQSAPNNDNKEELWMGQ
jgi:hypothetical protein